MNKCFLQVKHALLTGLVLSIWLVGAGASALPAEETNTTRLAIVDVGIREPVRSGFVELIVAAISADSGITLLERKEINRLLNEQALALQIRGAVESQTAVKAGQTWGTDAFLMLEAQSNSVVRVRLVDTRYGIVLWDSAFVLGPTANELTEQAAVIAMRTQQKLPLLQQDLKKVCAVSMASIRCEEVSRRFDWMAERLAIGIEQQLGSLPGMLLLERRSTRSLTQERTVVDGLPEALRAAVMLVEGDFKIGHTQEGDTVTLTVRGRRGRTVVFEERMTGPVKDLDQLCRQTARVIAEKVGVAALVPAMNPAHEAQMLVAEARGCDQVGEPLRALELAEAAHALQPQNSTNTILVLQLLTHTSGLIQNNETAALAAADYGLNVADQLLRDPAYAQPKVPTQMYNSDCEITYALLLYARAWTYRADAAAELDATFWDVFARAGETERRHGTPAYTSYLELKHRLAVVQRTPEAAVQMMGTAWVDGVSFFEKIPDGFNGCWTLLLPANPFIEAEPERNCSSLMGGSFSREHWQSVADQESTYFKFLEKKSKDEDPVVRCGAELALLEIFAGRTGRMARPVADPVKTAEHLEKLLAILETHLIPQYGSLHSTHDVLARIAYRPLELRHTDEPTEDRMIRLRYGCRVMEAALTTGQGMAAYAFLNVITEIVPLLQQAGQSDQAVDYLARTLTLCGDMPYQKVLDAKALLGRLRPDHPLAAGTRLAVLQPPAQLHLCFSMRSAGSDWLAKENARFKRIARTETGWAVLFSAGNQLGILKLTPEFKVTSEQHFTFTQPAKPNGTGMKSFFNNRPVLTIDGDDVFVGFFGGAIIRFVKGMAPLQLQDTGGSSSYSVEHLAVLNHRLYAIVDSGGNDNNALAEIDVTTGASTILFSSRAKIPKNTFDGRPLRGLLADPARQCLWLFGGCIREQGHPVSSLILGQYNSTSGSVVPKQNPQLSKCFFGDGPGSYLARSGDVILMGGRTVCKRLDIDGTNVLSTTVVEGPDFSTRSPPIAVGNDLVGSHKNQLIYYKADVCEPFYALDSQLVMSSSPPKRRRPRLVIDSKVLSEAIHGTEIRDLFSLGKNFLVLTDNALWLVEMPSATDVSQLESSDKSP